MTDLHQLAPQSGREFVLTVSCEDRRGIVHAVAGAMLEQDLTILDSQQFGDDSTGEFHLRMHLRREGSPVALSALQDAFTPIAERFGMQWRAVDR